MAINIKHVLKEAFEIGLAIEHGSAERAWIKAAYLFIEHYVFGYIKDEKLMDGTYFVQEATIKLIREMMLHTCKTDCNGNVVQNSSSKNCLPIRKSFISIKRLTEKNKDAPCHSHIEMNSYAKVHFVSTCKYSDWKVIPGVLIGILKPGNSPSQFTLVEKSGSIIVNSSSIKPEHLDTISLLLCWNYIPSHSEELRYVELLTEPIVLKSLKPERMEISHPTAMNNMQYTVDQLLKLLQDSSLFHDTFCLTGYVHCLSDIDSDHCEILLCALPTWKFVQYCDETCGIEKKSENKIRILLKSCEMWKTCLNIDSFVELTNLQAVKDFKSSCAVTTTTTSDFSVSYCRNDVLKSLQENQVEVIENLLQVKTCFCSYYVGKVFDVLSKELQIMLLDDGKALLFLKSLSKPLLGIRLGAIIVVRNSHLCEIDGRPAFICCKSSTIEVLDCSDLQTLAFVCGTNHGQTSNDTWLSRNFNPYWLYSIASLCNYLSPYVQCEKNDDLLKLNWVRKLMTSCEQEVISCGIASSDCKIHRAIIDTPQLPFKCFPIETLRDHARNDAKYQFANNTGITTTHESACFLCNELISDDNFEVDWKDNAFCCGMLQCGTSGCLRFSDGRNSLKCLVLANHFENDIQPEESFDAQRRRKFSSCAELVGCLVRFKNFSMIVEKQAVQSDATAIYLNHSVSHNCLHQYEYIVYFVVQKENIVVLKPKCDNLLFDNEKGKKKVVESCGDHQTSVQLKANFHLLFIMHKGPLLSLHDGQFGFCITVVKRNESSKLSECHVEFRGRASAWYSLLHPAMLIEIGLKKDKSEEAFQDCFTFDIDNCALYEIENANSRHFAKKEVESFLNEATKFWQSSHYSCGVNQIFSIKELISNPPSPLPQIVAVNGRVIKRTEVKNALLRHYLTLTLMSEDKFSVAVRIQLTGHWRFNLLGLVVGAQVTFFRLKCKITVDGLIYCKYIPTSFHIVHSVSGDYVKDDETETRLHVKLPISSLPLRFLHACIKEVPIDDCQILRVQAFVTRTLNVKMSVGVPFTDVNDTFMDENMSSSNLSFHAKCVISDGSARAILHFSSNTRNDFCRLVGIESEEWDDILKLLQQSSSKTINYDCNLQDGKELLINRREPDSDRVARLTSTALFNDVNSRPLASRSLLVRRRVTTKNRSWISDKTVDRTTLGILLGEESLYKISTVPVENNGSSSVRSVSARLTQLNCLAVV